MLCSSAPTHSVSGNRGAPTNFLQEGIHMKISIRAGLLLAVVALLALPVGAEEVRVTITTTTPADGVFLTPPWVGFHDGAFDTYNRNEAVTDGLERLAEDGAANFISDEFAAAEPLGVQGVLAGPDGPLFPGVTVSQVFDLVPSYHRYFSYASMVIPSNDAFVSNGNPVAHRVFDTNGNFTPTTFYILGNQALDAGTEVNDELETSTAAAGQSAANTGTDENGVVTVHPGHIPSGRILGLRAGGQFIDPGYVLAKVTIDRPARTTIRFSGSGAQENPPVSSDATAACGAVLNSTATQVTFNCEHNVEDVQAAHVHMAAVGSNGAVLFPFDSAESPISQTFDVTADDVAAFLAGDLYVNVHSTDNPSGEVRAQVAGCFAGPESLCLMGGRFQVSATYSVDGDGGQAQALPATTDAGQFTFFDEANVELDIKVLDGCAITNYVWVFIAGLTDVGVEITVTDTITGAVRSYASEDGTPFELIRDVEAFATCS